MTAAHIPDEQRDAPLISVDLVYLLGHILVVFGFAIGAVLGSWLLHSFDAEIRHGLASMWDILQRLYWASLQVQG